MLQESRLSRCTLHRYSRSISQRSCSWLITTRHRMNRTKVQRVGWTCTRRHTYRLTPEENKRYQGQEYLTLNKAGKNGPMKLRSDFRAAVLMKIRLHHESGEQVEEPILPDQYRRWHPSSRTSWWNKSEWNWNWAHKICNCSYIFFVTVGFVYSRLRSTVTDGSVDRNTSHFFFHAPCTCDDTLSGAHSFYLRAIHDVTCLSVRCLSSFCLPRLYLSPLFFSSTVHLFSDLDINFHNVVTAEGQNHCTHAHWGVMHRGDMQSSHRLWAQAPRQLWLLRDFCNVRSLRTRAMRNSTMRSSEKRCLHHCSFRSEKNQRTWDKAYHSHDESLLPAQPSSAHTSTERPVCELSSHQTRKSSREMENMKSELRSISTNFKPILIEEVSTNWLELLSLSEGKLIILLQVMSNSDEINYYFNNNYPNKIWIFVKLISRVFMR